MVVVSSFTLAPNVLRTGALAVLKHQTVEYAQCKFNEIMFIYPLPPLLRQCAVIGRAVFVLSTRFCVRFVCVGLSGRSLNFYRRDGDFYFFTLRIHRRAVKWQAYLQPITLIP